MIIGPHIRVPGTWDNAKLEPEVFKEKGEIHFVHSNNSKYYYITFILIILGMLTYGIIENRVHEKDDFIYTIAVLSIPLGIWTYFIARRCNEKLIITDNKTVTYKKFRTTVYFLMSDITYLSYSDKREIFIFKYGSDKKINVSSMLKGSKVMLNIFERFLPKKVIDKNVADFYREIR